MGNSTSKTSIDENVSKIADKRLKDTSFGQIIDYIATKYILTMDFQSLTKLYEKEYCNELVILTSDIIKKYFTDLEITYLDQRIKNGVEENTMTNDNLVFLNKSDIDKLSINTPLKRKRMCVGIAKFYIKIAHIFAAIVTTINPVYTYKDSEGNIIKTKLYEKGQIPQNVERKLLKLGICDNRINSLKKGQDYNKIGDDGKMSINPDFCGINLNSSGETKYLNEEPGITELAELYYDKYDYQTGKFIGMTEETQQKFKEDLKKFYTIFTGNVEMPDNINKFGDIKLRDYQKNPNCQGEAPFRKKVVGELIQYPKTTENFEKNELNMLFIKYAENIKEMMQTVNKSQDDLLEVINDLFTYVIDEKTGSKTIIVNPKLSEKSLQDLVVKTRDLIVNLYLQCENDYVKGVKLYQAIVEKQIKDTTIKQIAVLEKASEALLDTNNNKPKDVSINPPIVSPPLPITPPVTTIQPVVIK